MRTLSRPRSARKNSAPRPNATARVATPSDALELAEARVRKARQSLDAAIDARLEARDALRGKRPAVARIEAETPVEQARPEAPRGRPVDLHDIGCHLVAIRELVKWAHEDLGTAQVANHAADVELQGGTAKVLVERATAAISELQDRLSWIGYSAEVIAGEIGMKVDPGETEVRLDSLEFPGKRAGVVYGRLDPEANQQEGAA